MSRADVVDWISVVVDISMIMTWWLLGQANLKAYQRVAGLQKGRAAGTVTAEDVLAELQGGSD